MGRELGCFGHIAELRRTEVDPFTPGQLVTLQQLEDASPERERDGDRLLAPPADSFGTLDALLLDTGAALSFLPQVVLSDDAARRVRLGNPAIVRGAGAPIEADEACAMARGRLVALGAIETGMFHPRRVFRD
jgi:tRNA pseudouridine55 synthase